MNEHPMAEILSTLLSDRSEIGRDRKKEEKLDILRKKLAIISVIDGLAQAAKEAHGMENAGKSRDAEDEEDNGETDYSGKAEFPDNMEPAEMVADIMRGAPQKEFDAARVDFTLSLKMPGKTTAELTEDMTEFLNHISSTYDFTLKGVDVVTTAI